MNQEISIMEQSFLFREKDIENLLVQIDNFRERTQWLIEINKLYSRLARTTDVRSILEGYSVWLTSHVKHDLLLYRSKNGFRQIILCSHHGPDKQELIEKAQYFLSSKDSGDKYFVDSFIYSHEIRCEKEEGVLLLLRKQEVFSPKEKEILARSIEILKEYLERGFLYEELFEQARKDQLTGLDNRRVFREKIDQILEQSKRYGFPVTIAAMDLDNFKQINDTWGHAVGDKVLQTVANTLKTLVRKGDLLIRMGGDEFLLIMPYTDYKAAQTVAQRIYKAIDDLNIVAHNGLRLGISIGIVQWQDDLTIEKWLQKADEALYKNKKDRKKGFKHIVH
jgi:diguanylate cyclase (GGDEF)-like protein